MGHASHGPPAGHGSGRAARPVKDHRAGRGAWGQGWWAGRARAAGSDSPGFPPGAVPAPRSGGHRTHGGSKVAAGRDSTGLNVPRRSRVAPAAVLTRPSAPPSRGAEDGFGGTVVLSLIVLIAAGIHLERSRRRPRPDAGPAADVSPRTVDLRSPADHPPPRFAPRCRSPVPSWGGAGRVPAPHPTSPFRRSRTGAGRGSPRSPPRRGTPGDSWSATAPPRGRGRHHGGNPSRVAPTRRG
jgi:hypothetical protein